MYVAFGVVPYLQLTDSAAMKAVYSRYVRYLAAVCSRYILNSEDVKDVLQDSFLKIFSGIESFEYRGEGSLKAWLAKVTVNEILKFLRRDKRMELVEISDSEHGLPEDEPDIDALPSSLIYSLIRELPDGYRTIFNLYVVENKSHKEISELLGIKESASPYPCQYDIAPRATMAGGRGLAPVLNGRP